jgi:hypothetical protein
MEHRHFEAGRQILRLVSTSQSFIAYKRINLFVYTVSERFRVFPNLMPPTLVTFRLSVVFFFLYDRKLPKKGYPTSK